MEENPVSSSNCRRQSLRKNVSRNYSEKLMDEFMDKHLGIVPRKRNRTKADLEKETEKEAMIALSLGFPIDALLAEEIEARVVSKLGGIEQNDYIVVRNHILSRWRENVCTWLSKREIMETVSHEYEGLMHCAYDFLLSRGYINFGVSSSIKLRIPKEGKEGSVVIVGSGLAGLAAARQLLAFGFKVVVLEGRRRPGGRVYTKRMGRKGMVAAAADLGASVITGIHANPLGVLARQLSLPLHKVRDKCPLYKPDGTPVDEAMDSSVEYIFNELLNKVTEFRQFMGESATDISLGSAVETFRELYAVASNRDERQLLDWHLANLEYANAGCLPKLSAAFWDQDDPYEMGGDHCLLAGGNCRLIHALCDGVPIFYGKTVEKIVYGSEGVEVIAGDQVFQADMVLCTVPLGVLKSRSIKFVPELPRRKLDAIDRLGFGLLNKVAMLFPSVFWGEDLDTFGCLNAESHRRGEFFLFYSYHMVSGGPLLIALVAGEAALEFERTDPSASLSCVLSILRGVYSPRGINVPDPIQTICTRWGSDSLCRGSFSHVGVGSSGYDYDILAESLGEGRLFFAGEATNRQYPATMHGAFLSGLREASCILSTARSWQIDSGICLAKNVGPTKSVLADLFRTPDLELGKFSFIFDPTEEDPKSMVLMSVTFGKSKMETSDSSISGKELESPQLQLYSMLSREQALELSSMTGGDESKLAFLCRNLGLKLMGTSGLGSIGNSLVFRITSARRRRSRHQLAVKQCP